MGFAVNAEYYRIFVLITGRVVLENDGKQYEYDERVTFVPMLETDLTIYAQSHAALLEIQWDIASEDAAMLEEYQTKFPICVPYKDSIQYIDPNKSVKTISRMMIPQRQIPRFSLGSVESYGYDYVRPHNHPMLDQFFFSFPENDMEVIINGEKIHMGGNMMLHIPLGADHGVEVTGDRHMHYMWIDFMPDNELALQRLDARHIPTGTVRSFDRERKQEML